MSHANNGVVHGAILTADRFGKPNGAYPFDGVDDYIEIPAGHDLSIHGRLTLSAWVKPTSFGNTAAKFRTIVWGKTSYYLSLSGTPGSAPGALANYWYEKEPPGYILTAGRSAPTGRYTHIVSVWDDTSLTQYVDGDPVKRILGMKGIGRTTNGVVRIGREGGPRGFHGLIDDVRIYDRALSEREVRLLYELERNL